MRCRLLLYTIITTLLLVGTSGLAYATRYDFYFNSGCDGGLIDADNIVGFAMYNGRTAKLAKGCLAQFIYAGANNTINSPSASGGTTSDDILLLNGYVGSDEIWAVATNEGEFWYTYSGSVDATSTPQIYVRVWSTYEADILLGSFYGNSSLFSPDIAPNPLDDHALTTIEVVTFFDQTPPGPPSTLTVTQEASGGLIISWTPTTEPDTSGTRIVRKTGGYPAAETDGAIVANVSTTAAQSVLDTGLTDDVRYYYGAFSYDLSSNFSGGITGDAVSNDTLPPSVEAWSPQGTGVLTNSNIVITFNDKMTRASVESSIHISPAVGLTYGWSNGDKTVTCTTTESFSQTTTYTVTVDTNAADDALNKLPALFNWNFKTAAGLPPTITDIKIDGWKRYPGDVISPRPKISATIDDPELGGYGIASIEISAGSLLYMYVSPEISSVFDRVTGNFDARFPFSLPEGAHTITLKVWDVAENVTWESQAGLQVMGNVVKLIGAFMNYPNPFDSSDGTTFAYTLTTDANIELYIYSIKGSIIYKAKYPAGTAGGTAGYNEVFWNGSSSFGEKLGNGMYIVKVTSGGKVIDSRKIVVQNKP